ncbi:MAG: N-6 DNA methylase [Phycisphaerales bacterium]|nr:N-6 DNA methylase [Phycisphaerales bacterium]
MSKKKSPVLAYLEGLHDVHGTGKATAEQSYKSKLEALLTAIGEDFDPELFATMELKQEGAGQPDLGIFEKKSGNLRLVVEVKGTKDNIHDTASGDQVSKYWKRYGFVLVTNFREFVFVARDAETGEAKVETRYRLSATSEAFWRAKPAKLAEEHEQGLTDYLEGVFARPSPIVKPKDLAADLARHAREAKRRLGRHSIDDLKPLQEAFERTLGLTFTDEQGMRFFRSSLVQTLFYGLFSAWMLWKAGLPKGRKPPAFDWRRASEHLDLPLIANLFDEVAKPTRLKDLDLRETLEWAAASLNRVNHAEFFASFDADHAITLFYEPFLEAFDPELREELGVWYTPPEIVRYMVERVDHLLRSELGIKDGLADDRVFVLDPAVGTGSFLLEVARRIHATLDDQGHGALAVSKVKKALCERVFGFEILTAPYVVAHLQLGILLRGLGGKLGKDERVSVYLTNALTGWEPPKGAKGTLAFGFLQDEQDRAAKIKREAPILVVLGNPPYRGNKGVALDEEGDLIRPYKEGLNERFGIRKQTLDDPYIRFFRLAERRIGDVGRRGIVCYISNYSWLNGIPHVLMRERLLQGFDTIYVDNLHGDRKAKERAPDGAASETVFAMRGTSPGIRIGTAIATMVKKGAGDKKASTATVARVEFRDFDDASAEKRRERLLASVKDRKEGNPREAAPTLEGRWSLLPTRRSAQWMVWPTLPALLGESFKGVQPGRGRALVDMDRAPLEERMKAYFDKSVSDADLAEACADLMTDEAGYEASSVRAQAKAKKLKYDPKKVVPIAWQPFDTRYMFDEDRLKLVHRRRPEFAENAFPENLFLACTQKPRHEEFPIPVVTEHIGSYYFFDPYATYFPMRRRHESLMGESIGPGVEERWLERICEAHGVKGRTKDGHGWTDAALSHNDEVFFHCIAALAAPAYAQQNHDALRVDWPRVPVPTEAKTLVTSAKLGRLVADLLMPGRAVEGVTSGKIRAALRSLAVPFKVGGGQIDPDEDMIVDGGWASVDKQGRVSMREGKVTPNDADPEGAVDVWINERVGWRNVPNDAWALTLGGYPVVNKWLSYREKAILGRPLTGDELVYVSEIVRRIAALLELADDLNANYAACAKKTIPLK